MIKLEDTIFGEGGIELGDTIFLETVGAVSEHGTVRISAFGIEKIIDSFSFITCRSPTGEYFSSGNALLNCLRYEDGSGKWILLSGTTKAVLINISEQTIDDPFTLYRSENDDQGFYSFEAHEFHDQVIVIYESGYFKIEESKISWHKQKQWNAITKSIESDSLNLFLEREDGTQVIKKIDTQTGELLSVEVLDD